MGNVAMTLMEKLGKPYSNYLLETWKKNIDAVKSVDNDFNDDKATRLALVLENTKNAFNRSEKLFEGTQPVDVGPFKRYAFSILTAVMPNLIAEDICSVQP